MCLIQGILPGGVSCKTSTATTPTLEKTSRRAKFSCVCLFLFPPHVLCYELESSRLSGPHKPRAVCSFGVTLWEMMTRKRPFGDMMSYQVQCNSTCSDLSDQIGTTPPSKLTFAIKAVPTSDRVLSINSLASHTGALLPCPKDLLPR